MMNLRFVIVCGVLGLAARGHAAPPAARHNEQRAKPVAKVARASPEALPAPPDFRFEESSADETVTAQPAERPAAAADDSWRYRYHMQRWWYFVEPGHWLFWDGHCWQDAQPTLPKKMPDGSIQRVGVARRALAAWPQVPSYREHHGWVGGFYSSGGGYGSSDFGYGYGIPSYGPSQPRQ
jgi:hypothetical protein